MASVRTVLMASSARSGVVETEGAADTKTPGTSVVRAARPNRRGAKAEGKLACVRGVEVPRFRERKMMRKMAGDDPCQRTHRERIAI